MMMRIQFHAKVSQEPPQMSDDGPGPKTSAVEMFLISCDTLCTRQFQGAESRNVRCKVVRS